MTKSNLFKFILKDKSWFVVRVSGAEPKMKVYISVVGGSIEETNSKTKEF